MPLVCLKDAKIMSCNFKNKAWYRDTYSAFEGLRTRAFDPGRLCDHPGIDWDRSKLLKLPLSMDSIPHFLVNFATLVLPLSAASNPYFVPCGLLMYGTIC